MEQIKGNKARGIFQILILSFFIIGTPIMSYVYLNKGYQYQKSLMSNLIKERQMPAVEGVQLLYGIEPDTLKGGMHLVNFVDLNNDTLSTEFGALFSRIHEQFDAPDNIDFMVMTPHIDSSKVHSFIEKNELDDEEQIRIYGAQSENAFATLASNFGLDPTQITQTARHPFVAMVDDSLYVRVIYKLDDDEQLFRLIEQVAVMLPERNKPKARLQRETEK